MDKIGGVITSWFSRKSTARIQPAILKKEPTVEDLAHLEHLRELALLADSEGGKKLLTHLSQRLLNVMAKSRIAPAGQSSEVYNAEIEGRKQELSEIINEISTANEKALKLEKDYYGKGESNGGR